MICPQCKEEMPLLSRICPVCGYTADTDESRLSAIELADSLEQILHSMRGLPTPSFSRSMSQLSVIMLPILTLFLLAAALISEAGIFWIATALFALGSLIAILLKLLGRLGNTHADNLFRKLKNDYEYTARIARRDYGKNREVSTLLTEIAQQIDRIEQNRKQASRRNLVIWIIILCVGFALAAQGVRSVNKAVATQAEIGWQEEVAAYEKAQSNDEYDSQPRTELLKKIVAANAMQEAETFFRNFCMGHTGDYDCASIVVDHYLQAGDKSAAEAFVQSCKLRYGSDLKKLKTRLTN